MADRFEQLGPEDRRGGTKSCSTDRSAQYKSFDITRNAIGNGREPAARAAGSRLAQKRGSEDESRAPETGDQRREASAASAAPKGVVPGGTEGSIDPSPIAGFRNQFGCENGRAPTAPWLAFLELLTDQRIWKRRLRGPGTCIPSTHS